MADDKSRNQGDDSEKKEETDGFGTADTGDSDFGAPTDDSGSGLGNLPPLSDFESSSGGGFDSGLPPLSSIDSDSDRERGSVGGLPPISDIPVETPVPTGGAVKPPPSRVGSTPTFGTPSSDSGLDTPSGTGFQDLSADSDFTPETPEVAPPGPESDIDTPLFDSAFGGSGGFSAAADTSAPTQAMETPMFGADQGGGFDADAFGSGAGTGGAFEQGTPVPDFGPDTAAPTAMTPPPAAAAQAGKGGAKGGLLLVAGLVVGALVGLIAGPRVPGVPNPAKSEVSRLTSENQSLNIQLEKYKQRPPGTEPISEQRITELLQQEEELTASIDQLTQEQQAADTLLTSTQSELNDAQASLDATTAEFVQAQKDYEDLANQTAVTRARRDGLQAETDRLESLTGKLTEADTRRMLTKETLESNIERLEILVRESSPLAPEKYSRESRMAAVANLKARAQSTNWVDPALLDEYTALYMQELEISRSRDYFFAKLPVTDRFGTTSMSWAECVMNGNWGVYYRTLDGKHIGVYQNMSSSGSPEYKFIDVDDQDAAKNLELQIFASRTEGYEEKLELLAQKQLVTDDRTPLQRNFESL